MKEKIRLGYIGLGHRGYDVFRNCIAEMDDVEIVALCDKEPLQFGNALKLLNEKGKPVPYCATDYHDLVRDPSIDAVMIMSGWVGRAAMAREFLLAGKYTGIEVGCAYSLQECYSLIDAYEQSQTPLMMLENCCYGRVEMMVLNLAKKGLLGEIVHCKGGYMHDLRNEDLLCRIKEPMKHYRLTEYIHRNCEQYPTHELGPICKVLGINRGNRMMTLSSFSSKSKGLADYAKRNLPADSIYANIEYMQGDIVNTVITCANGETILLTLDTTLPRPYYSRDFTVRGTRGMYTEERKVLFLDGMEEKVENNQDEMFEKYDHPLHAEYARLGERGGHGGMDWLVCRAFVESVKNGTNTPIDAYDTVTLMSIATLSEMSIQKGGAPIDVPDFTNGKWFCREPALTGKYSLDEIAEDSSISIF